MSEDTVNTTNVWDRPHFEKPFDDPFLFFVLFGVENTQLYLSRKVHNIDECPKELNIQYYSKDSSDEERNYIEGFFDGPISRLLETQNKALFDQAITAKDVVVVSGTFFESNSLNYLKNCLGVVKALTMNKNVPILNYQTFQLMSSDDWAEKYFEPRQPNPCGHVVILYSKEQEGLWFHTRGMRVFGRPDLSLVAWPEDKTQEAQGIINRFIELYALGTYPEDDRALRVAGLPDGMITSLKGGHDNLDFNNYFIEITWPHDSGIV